MNYAPVVSFSAKLKGKIKAVSGLSFILDKIMSRYFIQSMKKNSEKIEEFTLLYSISYIKHFEKVRGIFSQFSF